MNVGPGEFLVAMMTALILPAVVVLIVAFFTGRLDAEESAKYMAVVGEPDGWDEADTEPAQQEQADRRCAT